MRKTLEYYSAYLTEIHYRMEEKEDDDFEERDEIEFLGIEDHIARFCYTREIKYMTSKGHVILEAKALSNFKTSKNMTKTEVEKYVEEEDYSCFIVTQVFLSQLISNITGAFGELPFITSPCKSGE